MFHINPRTLDFDLPENLIAQEPLRERDQARLLVLNRSNGKIEHRIFSDFPAYLKPGDVLVVNKAKVSRAKLIGRKPTGGKVEAIFLGAMDQPGLWKALVRPLLKEGTSFSVTEGISVVIEGRTALGEYVLRVAHDNFEKILERHGQVPLPPYIKRDETDARHATDQVDYQTVFAAVSGSVAAPTAGLHFSENLLSRLKSAGVVIVEVLLHVGWGTFRPIAGLVEQHQMLPEKYEVSESAFAELVHAKKENRRILAVGTTSTRTLESIGVGRTLKGDTSLFIKPGFQFQCVDALITNLHVPRSTPVSLTAAFAGLNNLEKAYAEAIAQKYRFFSYGDAMLIL